MCKYRYLSAGRWREILKNEPDDSLICVFYDSSRKRDERCQFEETNRKELP
jgi:hypothetical protein